MQKNLSLQVLPFDAPLGAEVRGLDLSQPISVDTAQALDKAWQAHLVLVFRKQHLSVEQHLAFTRAMGSPIPTHGASLRVDNNPNVLLVANVTPEGEFINDKALGNAELGWHRDLTYEPIPPRGSCLYAHEIPPAGGMTYFSNMYAACAALPETLRKEAKRLRVIHDSTRNSAGRARTGAQVFSDPRETPGAKHFMVCCHPWTKKEMIFFGRREGSYILDKPLAESETLLDQLWDHACQPAWAWGHDWEVGDVVLWDNLATMHRRDAFDGAQRRVLHRTQIEGQAPLPA